MNTIKNDDNLHWLNCLHSFRPRNKLESHKAVCKKHLCGVVIPSKDTKILELNQY